MKTIFCDIDGVILHQPDKFISCIKGDHQCELQGAAEKLLDWHCAGHRVILVTGRPEHMRAITERNLQDVGVLYDQLVMNAGSGTRYLINDFDPKHETVDKAIAITLPRNRGLGHVELR